MKPLKRAIHIDFHTLPDIPDFGKNFDVNRFARTLQDARVRYVNVFAKCNIGFAYYPTKIGIVHPYLNFDMLGQIVKACHKVDIGVSAYFNVGLDHEMARKHRDWTIVNKEGQVIYGDRTANFFRNMCMNSGYKDYLLGMIREVVEQYPVDGVFLDCMGIWPCHGDECCQSVKELGMDPLSDEDIFNFSRQSMIQFSKEVKQIVGNDKYLYLNGLGFKDSKGLRTHEEIECLPSGWGYDFFPAQAAYARNLDQPALYMTGRFHVNWGDFGGLKSKASLENDCWDAISNAVGVSIGDHMHPRDGLESQVYKIIGEIYRDIEALEPWTDDAKAIADVAILAPDEKIANAHNGAVRMLGELKYTYDIIDESMDFSPYQVIILPDEVLIGAVLKEKLEAHLARGGGVISSGRSGLNPEKTGFAMDEWNMEYLGEDDRNIVYFKMIEQDIDCLPDRLCAIYNPCIRLQKKGIANEIASYYEPYFNRHWDGFHGYFYTPPNKPAGQPAVARSGNIFQCVFNLFTDYYDHAMPEHKYLLGYCLQQLLDCPVIKCENIPSTSRVTVTKKDRFTIIHVKATYPELRGKYSVIEEHNEIHGGVVMLKNASEHSVKAVYTAPDKAPLIYEQVKDYVRISLPAVKGYKMVVVEHDG